MDLKKLHKKIDRALAVLSDHDDKKDQERYINLQRTIEEVQDYIEKGNHSEDLNSELYYELKKNIKEFEEDSWLFMLFLIILCGLLFTGVFYVTYSHFYDHFYNGGVIVPSNTTTTKKRTTTKVVDEGDKTTTNRHSSSRRTTKRTTRKTSSTSKITETTSESTTSVTTKHHDVTSSTKPTSQTTSKSTSKTTETTTKTTSSTSKTTSSTTTTKKTTTPVVDPDPEGGFVTIIFDNSSLIDLNNISPMLDSDGLKTTPTKWSLDSVLNKGSRDYVITYTIDFVDKVDDILVADRLNPENLKYQLLIKKSGKTIYNSGTQELYDYPEATEGVRPILTAQTYTNNESLDFELRMWLASHVGNDQQGKKYRFNINVSATYEFCDNGLENGACKS